jgi:Fur family ferric uptake transcriptional regulator
MHHERHERLRREFHRIFQSDGLNEVDLRDEVLDEFLASDDHVGVEDLTERLRGRGVEVDEEKVRRFLELFTAYGIARVNRFEGLGRRWEHHHLGTHHDHLVCVKCGRISEFESDEIERLQDEMARSQGFKPVHHRLVVYGVCDSCGRQRQAGFPLAQTAEGESVQVEGVRGPASLSGRLESMGLNSGAVVQIMRNDGSGPIIVASGDTRLGVDRDLARRVRVVPTPPPGGWPGGGLRRRRRRRGGTGERR